MSASSVSRITPTLIWRSWCSRSFGSLAPGWSPEVFPPGVSELPARNAGASSKRVLQLLPQTRVDHTVHPSVIPMMQDLLAYFLNRLPRRSPAPRLDQCHIVRRQLHRRSCNMEYPPLEEQTLPRFYEKRYYPVKIGQTLNDRYYILTKLGYGANSTVWLARDRRTSQYTSIKVFVRDDSEASPVANELNILRHIATCSNEHAGAALARLADDTFEVGGHSCLAMKPQACSLQQLQNLLADYRVPREFIMAVVMRLLGCINWLQLDCGVVHTGMFARPRKIEG